MYRGDKLFVGASVMRTLMEPIYRVVGSRAKCRLTPTYDQAWGLKYSTVLDLPRGAMQRARARRARRAALVTRIGRMKVKLKACHTLGRAHLQFTRWLIKPTSEARNTGAATCDTCTIQCTAAPRMSHIGHVRRMEDHLSCPHTREERHCPRRANPPNSVLWGRRGVYATGLRVIESCTSITS